MATFREWILRAWSTVRPRRHDHDLEQEMRLHQELAGETGGLPQAMEAMRDQRGLPWLDDFLRDTRHAWRLLRRNPGFTVVAVLSLALGIGANSALFSFADWRLLRPLAVRDPGSIVTISADAPAEGLETSGVSYPNYRDLREAARSFEGLLAYRLSRASFAGSRGAARELYRGMLVSENFFDVLGVPPAMGRTFIRDEGRVPGRDAVVVLSYDFWQNVLGGDRSIVNKVVWVNGIDFRVVGVMPAGFTGLEPIVPPAFYVPLMMADRLTAAENPLEKRDARSLTVKGRLQSGVSRESARAELAILWKALAERYPDVNRNRTIAVRTELEEQIHQDPEDTILLAILMSMALIVLTIACANVANLMLGRGRARSREMALRLALGVSRARLVRQLLTEGLLLAGMGLVLGWGIAYGGIRFLQTIPTSEQIAVTPHLDHRAVLFSAVIAAMSALLCGMAPARQGVRTNLVPALKASDGGDTTAQRTIGRHVLVIGQLALSMVLLLAAGMLFDGFRQALVLDPGFRTDHLVMMSSDTSWARYTPAQTHAFYRDLVNRARGLPGAASVALTSSVPFDFTSQNTETVVPEGFRFPPGQEYVSSGAAIVDEHFFAAMHIQVLRGRGFTTADQAASPGVAVVNEEFAKKYWPGADPIGKRLRLKDDARAWLEVVGVTRTGKYVWIAETPMPFLYLPFAQHERTRMSLLVETTSADAGALAAPLRDVLRTLDVNLPVLNVQTYARLFQDRAIAVPRILMQIIATMGFVGLVLALVGLYALVAYSVARRTREIGIRMAIGASKSEVVRMVLRQGLMLSIGGVALGGIMSIVVARLLAAALAGIGTPSPITYIVVPVALVCLTLAASVFPARRASRVDPLAALRCD